MNDKNLIPFSERTARERKKLGKKGAKKSNKIQNEKTETRRTLQQIANDILYAPITLPEVKELVDRLDVYKGDTNKNNFCGAFMSALVQAVKCGNYKAVKDLMEMAGEKPAEKVEITTNDSKVIELQEYINAKKGKPK